MINVMSSKRRRKTRSGPGKDQREARSDGADSYVGGKKITIKAPHDSNAVKRAIWSRAITPRKVRRLRRRQTDMATIATLTP
jgi:hypothetical protein